MTEQAKRWEFVPGTEITVGAHILRRIRALVDMPGHDVKTGDIGGYVENEKNLPQDRRAWVYDNALVYGSARVYGKACVCGEAQVYGEARVYGEAQVYGEARVSSCAQVYGNAQVYSNAQVYGEARVYHSAQVYDNAQVYGEALVSGCACVSGDAVICSSADWITVGPAVSSRRFTTAHRDTRLGVRVNCGCFSGSLAEFAAAIEKTHQNSPQDLARYRAFHRLIMDVFGKENTNAK